MKYKLRDEVEVKRTRNGIVLSAPGGVSHGWILPEVFEVLFEPVPAAAEGGCDGTGDTLDDVHYWFNRHDYHGETYREMFKALGRYFAKHQDAAVEGGGPGVTTTGDKMDKLRAENEKLQRANENFAKRDGELREEITRQAKLALDAMDDPQGEQYTAVQRLADGYRGRESELASLQAEVERLSGVALARERDRLRTENKELRRKWEQEDSDAIADLKSEVNRLRAEVEELRGSIKTCNGAMEEFRRITNCPEGVFLESHLKELTTENDRLRAENEDLRRDLEFERNARRHDLDANCSIEEKLQEQVTDLTTRNEKLERLLTEAENREQARGDKGTDADTVSNSDGSDTGGVDWGQVEAIAAPPEDMGGKVGYAASDANILARAVLWLKGEVDPEIKLLTNCSTCQHMEVRPGGDTFRCAVGSIEKMGDCPDHKERDA